MKQLRQPQVRTASVKLMKPPAAIRPKAPKLFKVAVHPAKTSAGAWAAKAVHHLTNGSKRSFVFTDPMKLGQHLERLGRAAWRKPGSDEASSIVHQLDIAG